MSTALSNANPLPLVIPYQPMRMSVADYHKLIANGTLAENHRIELLRGVLVIKMTQNLEVYSNPTTTADGSRYTDCQEYQTGDSIPVTIDSREVGTLAAAELLPVIAMP